MSLDLISRVRAIDDVLMKMRGNRVGRLFRIAVDAAAVRIWRAHEKGKTSVVIPLYSAIYNRPNRRRLFRDVFEAAGYEVSTYPNFTVSWEKSLMRDDTIPFAER